jgi:hypothetical protein
MSAEGPAKRVACAGDTEPPGSLTKTRSTPCAVCARAFVFSPDVPHGTTEDATDVLSLRM